MKKILIVDDDKEILRLIDNIFKLESVYETTFINDILSLEEKDYYGYDLIILDIMLGVNISGYDICEKIRRKIKTPILFLTAKTDEEDLIKGLSVGGDDYIKKPFSPKELLARVKAHIDRNDRIENMRFKVISTAGVDFNLDAKSISINGENLKLTNLEYKITEFLALNKNCVFSIETIYDRVYDINTDSLLRNVSDHIYQIRKKFKQYDINPIKTVWGIGYKWEE